VFGQNIAKLRKNNQSFHWKLQF